MPAPAERPVTPSDDPTRGVALTLDSALPSVEIASIENDQLLLTATVPRLDDGSAIRPAWEALLLAGALQDQAPALDGAGRTSVALRLRTPAGAEQDIPAGVGDAPAGQRFEPVTEASARQLLRDGAEQLGLDLIRVEVLHVIDDAFAAYFTTTDARDSARAFNEDGASSLWTLFAGDPNRFEGVYLEIRDEYGIVLATAGTARTAGSIYWTRPGLGEHGHQAPPPFPPPTESEASG